MTVLILGATSDIAIALARNFASQGHQLQLAARSTEALLPLKSDIEIRHQTLVEIIKFDVLDFDSHYDFYNKLRPKPDISVLVFGYLGDHAKALSYWSESKKILDTNYVGAVSVLNVIANDYEQRRTGMIVGISSVAGERGRMSNYLYGSAKAGLTAYLSGLRNRLFHAGVHVLTVKPGFVRTKMTEGLKLPAPVTTDPHVVATKIVKAIKRKKNNIYVLPIWSLIMMVIRYIPESIFKKMKL